LTPSVTQTRRQDENAELEKGKGKTSQIVEPLRASCFILNICCGNFSHWDHAASFTTQLKPSVLPLKSRASDHFLSQKPISLKMQQEQKCQRHRCLLPSNHVAPPNSAETCVSLFTTKQMQSIDIFWFDPTEIFWCDPTKNFLRHTQQNSMHCQIPFFLPLFVVMWNRSSPRCAAGSKMTMQMNNSSI